MTTDFIQLKDKAGNGPVWINPMQIISMKIIFRRESVEGSPAPDGTKIVCTDVIDNSPYHVFELPGEVIALVILSNNKKLKNLAEVTNLVT